MRAESVTHTVEDVVRFLGDVDGSARASWGHRYGASSPVTHAAMDTRAGDGAIAWMSDRVHQEQPSRCATFGGTLLICPSAADVTETFAATRVAVTRPRLAFSLVVTRFFPEALRTEWPSGGQTIHANAVIHPSAELAPGVIIGSGVNIGAHVRVGPNTAIANAIIGERTTIGCNCSIGLPGFGYERDNDGMLYRFPHIGRVVIGPDVEIGSNCCIDRGALGDTSVADGAKIDNLVHLAHNVSIGAGALIVAHAMIAGSSHIGERAWIAPNASILDGRAVGDGAIVGLGAVVLNDVEAGAVVVGNPARVLR